MDAEVFSVLVIVALIVVGAAALTRELGARWRNIALYLAVVLVTVVGSVYVIGEVLRQLPPDTSGSVSNAPGGP